LVRASVYVEVRMTEKKLISRSCQRNMFVTIVLSVFLQVASSAVVYQSDHHTQAIRNDMIKEINVR